MTMTRKTISLFALACLTVIITGPFGAFMAYQKAQPPGTFIHKVIEPGDSFSPTSASRTVAVWAIPSDVQVDAVNCTLDGEQIQLDQERSVTDINGTEAVLLFTNRGDYSVFDRVVCTGGGIEEIRMSARLSESNSRIMMGMSLGAIPIMAAFGYFLFKRGYRWPLDKSE